MSISLHVDGRPGPCRRTARQLTRTSQAVADAADFLLRERHRSVDGLDGGAGLAYRGRVTTSANDAEMLSRCVAKLGRGLVELADAIEDVAEQMRRARELVEPYDLVRGDRLHEPVDQEGDDPHLVRARRLAYRDAADLVRQARRDEKEAQDDWRAALASYAVDLGDDMVPGIPSGTFLPPVEDAPGPPRPREQPDGHERTRHPSAPRPGEDSTPTPGPTGSRPSAAADASPGLPAGPGGRAQMSPVLAGPVLTGPVRAGPTLAGHVLVEGRPGARLVEAHSLDASPTGPDPQGSAPGGPPHLEVLHVPCHPGS